jgi:hypothetical protein
VLRQQCQRLTFVLTVTLVASVGAVASIEQVGDVGSDQQLSVRRVFIRNTSFLAGKATRTLKLDGCMWVRLSSRDVAATDVSEGSVLG